jgi:hypothetical protein
MTRLLAARQLQPGRHLSGSLKWTDTHNGRVVATMGYEARLLDPADAWLRLRYTTTRLDTGSKKQRDSRLQLRTTMPGYGGLRWVVCVPSLGAARAGALPAGRRTDVCQPPGFRAGLSLAAVHRGRSPHRKVAGGPEEARDRFKAAVSTFLMSRSRRGCGGIPTGA